MSTEQRGGKRWTAGGFPQAPSPLPSHMRQKEQGGLGLVVPSGGKIPRTFSTTPTHNTQTDEGGREKQGRTT